LQHVFDNGVNALGVLADDFAEAFISPLELFGFAQQLCGVTDRAQRVADFVGDTGGETAK